MRFAVDALVSTASYQSKKTTFILFINDRLVECAPLRRACELAYAAFSPKSERPFLFVALALPRDTVDVNVHPTKREVRFLHQDEIVESVATRLAAVLEANNETRAFRRAERLNATEETLEEETTETFEKNGAATGRRKSPTSGVAPRALTQSTLHAVDGVETGETRVREPTDPDLPAKRAKTTTRTWWRATTSSCARGREPSGGEPDAFFPRTTPGAPARGVAETPSNAVNAVNVANAEPTRVEKCASTSR